MRLTLQHFRFIISLIVVISFLGCNNIDSKKSNSDNSQIMKKEFIEVDTNHFKYQKFSNNLLISEKPILIYFNSIACVNCRKIESKILNTDGLWDEINKKFKFINLYVDARELADSTLWPQKQNKNRKTIGSLNNWAQIELTQTGSQPQLYFYGDTSSNNLFNYSDNFDDFTERVKKQTQHTTSKH